jgi:hypothetical protein
MLGSGGAQARPNAFVCTSSLSGVVITGDVVVPAGARCVIVSLNGFTSEVTGDVRVAGSFEGQLVIDGSLFAEKGSSAQVEGYVIHGNFQSRDAVFAGLNFDEHVDGNVIAVGSQLVQLHHESSVGGNVIVVHSGSLDFGFGATTIVIGGNLVCAGNGSVDTNGAVAAHELGQCAPV